MITYRDSEEIYIRIPMGNQMIYVSTYVVKHVEYLDEQISRVSRAKVIVLEGINHFRWYKIHVRSEYRVARSCEGISHRVRF